MMASSPLPPIAVIGGGPAGLIAAQKLAEAGLAVTVYDRMPSPARKFLMAGRGGLNLTNSEELDLFLSRYTTSSPLLDQAIRAFTPRHLMDWCHALGQETFVGSSGRVFPKGMKATALARVWIKRLEEMGVRFALSHTWRGWDEKEHLVFTTKDGARETAQASAVLLALGGASWPHLGSDGGWVSILERAEIPVAPLRPANCGFIVPWTSPFAERFKGQPLKPVTVFWEGRSLQGEIMITEKGVEGTPIYALSGALRRALDKGEPAVLKLDLRPGLSREELTKRLGTPRGSQSLSTFLRKAGGLSPVAIGLLREMALKMSAPLDTPEAIVRLAKALPLPLSATEPLDRAISTAGGLKMEALDAHFMVKARPGLFAAGEMLDWEAPTGGYLLQACLSTGVAAAKGIRKWLNSPAVGS